MIWCISTHDEIDSGGEFFHFLVVGVMALKRGFNICERLGEERPVLSITRISTGRFGHLMYIL